MLKFFRRVYRLIRAWMITVGLLVTVGLGFAVYLAVSYSQTAGIASKPAPLSGQRPLVLKLRLSGALASRQPKTEEFVLAQVFDEQLPTYLPQLAAALRRAGSDERVKGLFLELQQLSGDMAAFAELRSMLAAFRETGKPLHVHFSAADTLQYYLASVGTKVTASPAGAVMVPGPVLTLVYFGDLLRDLGVGIEVFRAGSYKSALEPLVANGPSPETLEDYGALEASLRDHLVATIAQGRAAKEGTVRAWLTDSFFDAEEALKVGLVDDLVYTDGAFEAFRETTGEDPRSVRFYRYASASRSLDKPKHASGTQGIALVEAVGEIADVGRESDGILEPNKLRARLKWAAQNDDVVAVVLRVDSPGGSALASDLMWREVEQLAAAKPLVVSMGAVAASGGYYLAAPASRILASPTTITGSIGVIAGIPNFEAFSEKYGVNFHVVTQTARAQLLDPGSPASDSDRHVLERAIANTYDNFLERVSDGRDLTVEEVDALAQGKVYTGAQALEIGLVDEIGGLSDAFAAAKVLAGLDPELLYPVYRRSEERFNIGDCLFGDLTVRECLAGLNPGAAARGLGLRLAPSSFLPASIENTERRITQLQSGKPLALLPYLPSLQKAGNNPATLAFIDSR